MPTIADLLLEIAGKEKELIGWLQTGVWPDDAEPAFDVVAATINDIRCVLSALRENTHTYIDSLTDETIEAQVPNPERWWEGLRLSQCPLSEVLRNLAAHEWHHIGQLVTYLWLRGPDPNDME